MNYTLIALAVLFALETAIGHAGTADSAAVVRPDVRAMRTTQPIVIDGVLSEEAWREAPQVSEFLQRDPTEWAPASERTSVRILYDDNALYVGARLYDRHPDSIVARVGRKDMDQSSDDFFVGLDPYNDHRTGFYFGIDAAGTYLDGVLYNDDWNDNSWDGVWEGRSTIDSLGWCVEMRIPFWQLRYHESDEQIWGIDFERHIRRKSEDDLYTFRPKNGSGFVSRFVHLVGLQNLGRSQQLEIMPYVTTRAEYLHYPSGDPFHDGSKYSPNLGLDLKLGLGSNLTLTGTVNPDFGQVEVDPAVVNLSDVETYYQEKRPFFIEGASIFNSGTEGSPISGISISLCQPFSIRDGSGVRRKGVFRMPTMPISRPGHGSWVRRNSPGKSENPGISERFKPSRIGNMRGSPVGEQQPGRRSNR